MADSKKHYTVSKESDSSYTLKIEIPAEAYKLSYEQLLADQLKKINIKGFRQGQAPRQVVEKDMKPSLLIESFERLAPYYVNSAIMAEKLDPIAPPEYSDLEDIDLDKVVKFTVKVTVMPQFKLGDLKKIKLNVEDVDPTKDEIKNTIDTMHKNNEDLAKKHPKIDDTWATEIGKLYNFPAVTTVKELESVIVDAIRSQKQIAVDQEISKSAVDQAITLSNIEIPQSAVDYEASQREEAFMKDIKQMGTTAEEFAQKQGITLDDLKERWLADSLQALQNDQLFKLYAEDRKLEIEDAVLEEEIKKAKSHPMSHNKAADMAAYDNPEYRAYIRSYLLKQKAYTEFMLEVDPRDNGSAKKPAKVAKSADKTKPAKKAAK